MARKNRQPSLLLSLRDQAANALVSATSEFLRRNNVAKRTIAGPRHRADLRLYRKLMAAYEYMGVLMGTWYSHPRFLDKLGNPLALNVSNGPRSIGELIRISRVPVAKRTALQLMECSPSIQMDGDGMFRAVNRVFMLPEFEVPRAALVVERFLDTLHKNFSRRAGNVALLERSCHVTGIDLHSSAPILRDIKERGAALLDVIDTEIEARRSRRSGRRDVGELGVLVFAWTKPNTKRAE
jgi:hypothetical protein